MDYHAAGDRFSPLASEIQARTRDIDWTLAHFSFVANVTTLAPECDIAASPVMSVASCRSMPKMALAFIGESAELLSTYATFLADPGSEVDLLVNEEQRDVVAAAFDVVSVRSKWQLVYRGDRATLNKGRASQLAGHDVGALQALARTEKVTLNVVSPDPLQYGPAFGIWERRKLVAMGTTMLSIPGAAQIDNVVTRHDYPHAVLGAEVVSALVLAHQAEGRRVFTVVNQDDASALALFEALEFRCERPMYLMTCVLRQAVQTR